MSTSFICDPSPETCDPSSFLLSPAQLRFAETHRSFFFFFLFAICWYLLSPSCRSKFLILPSLLNSFLFHAFLLLDSSGLQSLLDCSVPENLVIKVNRYHIGILTEWFLLLHCFFASQILLLYSTKIAAFLHRLLLFFYLRVSVSQILPKFLAFQHTCVILFFLLRRLLCADYFLLLCLLHIPGLQKVWAHPADMVCFSCLEIFRMRGRVITKRLSQERLLVCKIEENGSSDSPTLCFSSTCLGKHASNASFRGSKQENIHNNMNGTKKMHADEVQVAKIHVKTTLRAVRSEVKTMVHIFESAYICP